MTDPIARVFRALTADTRIRMAAVDASPLWDGVRRGHPHLPAEACAHLTELLTASLLLQSRSSFTERLQLLLRTSGRARTLVADAWPDGMVRGVMDVEERDRGVGWIQAPGQFQVMRGGVRREPSVGKLELVEGSTASQVEHYLQSSEQIQASLTLWCDSGTGEAGGLLAEPLPDCPPPRLARLVDGLEGLEVVPLWEREPAFLFRWLNQGDDFQILSETEVAYRCRCTREALLGVLVTFDPGRLREVFPNGEAAEIRCDYCGKAYHLSPSDLPGGGV